MSISRTWRLALGAVAVLALLGLPAAATATITGGCTGEGHATSGNVDLTTATEWHVKSTDVAGGSGQATVPAKSASVGAYALGLSIPIASGTSKDDEGETSGSVDGVSVSLFAALGARFRVSGSADNGCSGDIQIIIDDVNPLLTLFGGGGIGIAIVALLLVLFMTRGGSGIMKRLFDALFGAIGGIGAALALEQFDVIDPTEPIGSIIVLISAAVAFLTTGIFGGNDGKGSTAAPAAPSRPAPATATPMTPEEYGNTATDVFKGGDTPADPSVGGSASGNPDPNAKLGAKGDEPLPPGGVGGGGPM